MNKTIIADIEKAKELYPLVQNEIRKAGTKIAGLSSILDSFVFFDNVQKKKYDRYLKELQKKLHSITGKNISIIESYIDKWDEAEDEDICFRISLPEPKVIEDISQEEIQEIYEIVKQENFVNSIGGNPWGTPFEYTFFRQFNDYFQNLLEINLQYLLENYEESKGK